MNHIITSRLVVAALLCPRKAYFLLRGEPDTRHHEYEQIVEERATKNQAQ